jgi:hypothetical protein
MARTEERIRTIETATTPTPPAPARDRPGLPLVVAWIVGVPLAVALQPAAAVAEASWLDYVVSYALLASIITAVSALAARRPWAPLASLGASGVFLASTFACPATGHHAFGLWWFGQLAIAMTLVGMSAAHAWRARRV